jgi:hypothetical protein
MTTKIGTLEVASGIDSDFMLDEIIVTLLLTHML